MKIRNQFLIASRTVGDGHTRIGTGQITTAESHDAAIANAQARLDKRTYSSMVVYAAVTMVRRTRPPIEVLSITDDGEVE